MSDPMWTWQDPDGYGFKVELFDSNERDRYGKWAVPFKFYHKGELIFENTLWASPMHATDNRETLAAVLCFCSLKPGDTDSEFFADYSERQLEWCQEWGETLGLYEPMMEEATPQGQFRCAECLNVFPTSADCLLHHHEMGEAHDFFEDHRGELLGVRVLEEPQDGDYVTEDHRKVYEHGTGELLLEVGEDDDFNSVVRRRMEKEGFFPGCWWLSDHGNYHPINLHERSE